MHDATKHTPYELIFGQPLRFLIVPDANFQGVLDEQAIQVDVSEKTDTSLNSPSLWERNSTYSDSPVDNCIRASTPFDSSIVEPPHNSSIGESPHNSSIVESSHNSSIVEPSHNDLIVESPHSNLIVESPHNSSVIESSHYSSIIESPHNCSIVESPHNSLIVTPHLTNLLKTPQKRELLCLVVKLTAHYKRVLCITLVQRSLWPP